MKLKRFAVLFDHPDATYLAGQTLFGQVNLNIEDRVTTKGIEVEAVGHALARWTEERRQDNNFDHGNNYHHRNHHNDHDDNPRTYRGSENYLGTKLYVASNGVDNTDIPAGDHFFPFSIVLPANIPSSFEGKHGHIRYKIKINLIRNWKFDKDAEFAFTVKAVVDLQRIPKALEPCSAFGDKQICCFPCRGGQLSSKIALARSGFLPGEVLVFNSEVDNQTNRAVSKCFVQLVQIVTYRAGRNTKTDEDVKVTVEHEDGRIEPADSNIWRNKELQLPGNLPPSLMQGNVITVEYRLEVHAKSDKTCSRALIVPLNLSIATVNNNAAMAAPAVAMAPQMAPQMPQPVHYVPYTAQLPNSTSSAPPPPPYPPSQPQPSVGGAGAGGFNPYFESPPTAPPPQDTQSEVPTAPLPEKQQL